MVRFVAIREPTNHCIDRFVSNDDDDEEVKDNGQCMHRVKLNATNIIINYYFHLAHIDSVVGTGLESGQ